jgi:hypothetical protein
LSLKLLIDFSLQPKINLSNVDNVESQFIDVVEKLRMRAWRHDASLIPGTNARKMSVLHLAAALGFTKLVTMITSWRSQSLSLVLEAEMDAMALDEGSCTPLVRCSFMHIFELHCINWFALCRCGLVHAGTLRWPSFYTR